MMDLAEMSDFIVTHHHSDLFRLETRTRYATGSDGDDAERYHRGDEGPTVNGPWLARLRADTAAGRVWRKVHVVRGGELSGYERYEFEWGFLGTTGAGEDVRVLEVPADSSLDAQVGDYFVLDHAHVLLSHYDADDRHLGGEVVQGRLAATLVAFQDLAWSHAVPFRTWWEAHPQFHRAHRAS